MPNFVTNVPLGTAHKIIAIRYMYYRFHFPGVDMYERYVGLFNQLVIELDCLEGYNSVLWLLFSATAFCIALTAASAIFSSSSVVSNSLPLPVVLGSGL